MVKKMFNRKIVAIGILFIISMLVANMIVGNTEYSNPENNDSKPGSTTFLHLKDNSENSEYIVIRGSEGIIYLKIPNSLEDYQVEYIRSYYEEQMANEIPEEEISDSEEAEGQGLTEKEESETKPSSTTVYLTIPNASEPIEIEEKIITESNQNTLEEQEEIPPFFYEEQTDEINRFSSYAEFMDYLGYDPNSTSTNYGDEYYLYNGDLARLPTDSVTSISTSFGLPSVNSGSGYSTTNIQVLGVDEGDIIKNDAKYAYIVSKDKKSVIIADVFPAETARILTKVMVDGSISEIYLHYEKLILLGSIDYYKFFVYTFDIKDRANPDLIDSNSFNGRIVQSRVVGEYVYLITNQYISRYTKEEDLSVHPSQICYFNDSSTSRSLTTIISVNVVDTSKEPVIRAILMGSGNNIYVSVNNIYITYTKYEYQNQNQNDYLYSYSSRIEKTIIHRISIENGMIEYKAMGNVAGRALNRFSMGEHRGYFRIATTTGYVSRSGESSANNHVFVMNMNLNVVGSVSDIAPGERIYSARFMRDRAYLVTFKKVDPFFVIDLKNPHGPRILGELKIPGYSNYLHPYDENHVIGIGKDTVEAEQGNFAWYQGVKLSLFDVSDVHNPKELSKYIIGDRGTGSPALYDPHAFLFSREKNTLVIPINLAKINQTKYPDGAPPFTHGEFVWDGAYVFDISKENGFILKGGISHSEGDEAQSGYWYRSSSKSIQRSFYIDDVLYTMSSDILGMNGLDDLSEINNLVLSDA
ncbi:MAG: beta-propeller domain-containing protein [Thermoplasmata archaeon]|nr:MAG: beta-propeller domain-containing protein [Thermoplasmata archaeon]